ncbi:MAG: trypsin-like peptidase domain-containing protein [Planctomycetaceae bacterium]|nr:trypsin-like peptidase domain-containing protein [Planctomycetaceae bacterium]
MLARVAVSVVSLLLCASVFAQDSPSAARVTPLVKVIRQIESGVVSLFIPGPNNQLAQGSGTIIHPDGFALTNDHVLPANEGFALLGAGLPNQQQPVRFRVIGRYPERDLAVIRLDGPGPFPTVAPARSHDLMNGESVVVAGNPGGRGLVFTSGIISAASVLGDAPNALVMTNYRIDYRPRFIQFDAASNGGNSGGPLINMDGHQIGIVSAKITQEQNVGFAIPIDTAYQLAHEIIGAELRSGQNTGISIQMPGAPAIVQQVEENSAAAEAGVQPGDLIVSLNGRPVRHVIDWELELTIALPRRQPLAIQLRRNDNLVSVTLQPQPLLPLPADNVDESHLTAGLHYELFHGQYSLLPDFAALTSVSQGTTPIVSLDSIKRDRNDYYAVAMTGFLKVDQDGLCRLVLTSDDGSRAFLNGNPVIDNDGNHPPYGVGRWLSLQKGLHPIRIEYFQGNGGAEVGLSLQKYGTPLQPVPAAMLMHVSAGKFD